MGEADEAGDRRPGGNGDGPTRPAGAPGPAFRPRAFEAAAGFGRGAPGRRTRARSPRGAVVAASAEAAGLHLPATLLAAAPHQVGRGRTGTAPVLDPADRRGPLRLGREGNLVLFVVDASGSMAARRRLAVVTAAVLSLLEDAYQRRDRVGLITFRGAGAAVVLPPTSSVDVGAGRLASLPVGGRTPLAAGLGLAADVLRAERRRDPDRRPLLVVVTDGRATHGPDPLPVARALARTGGSAPLTSVVVDCESGYVRLGLAARLADALGAAVVGLDALPASAPAASAASAVPAAPAVSAAPVTPAVSAARRPSPGRGPDGRQAVA
jgi:magnesium chelatase subunit D